MNLSNYSCPMFSNKELKGFIDIGDNILVVILNDNRIFIIKPYGFWGEIGEETLVKGNYSNREYSLKQSQINKSIEAKNQLIQDFNQ